MRVEVRIYKRHDLDLLSLRQQGVPVLALMEEAVTAYANGKPMKILVPHVQPYRSEDLTVYHAGLNIKDPAAEAMLQSVDKIMRNQLCKNILRNALAVQSIGIYFHNDKYHALDDAQREEAAQEGGVLVCKPNNTQRNINDIMRGRPPGRNTLTLINPDEQVENDAKADDSAATVNTRATKRKTKKHAQTKRTDSNLSETEAGTDKPSSETIDGTDVLSVSPPVQTDESEDSTAELNAKEEAELFEMMKGLF